jgi:hypothetical protein
MDAVPQAPGFRLFQSRSTTEQAPWRKKDKWQMASRYTSEDRYRPAMAAEHPGYICAL